jgi:hypothetical protein
MVVPAQVEHAVHGRLDLIRGVLGADDDVAQLARPGRGARLVDREREDVGRLVLAAMVAVELADPCLADQLDGQVSGQAGGGQRRLRGAAELLPGCLDLAQTCFCWYSL